MRHLKLEWAHRSGESHVKVLASLFAGHAEEIDACIKRTLGPNDTPSRREGKQGGLLTYKKCARNIKLVAIQFALSLLGSSCVNTSGTRAAGARRPGSPDREDVGVMQAMLHTC